MEAIIPIAAFAGLAALFGVIWYVSAQMEKKRSLAFEQVAGTLGLTFEGEPNGPPINWSSWLFEQGRNRQTRNYSRGQYHGVDVRLFDYYYVTGSGKNRTTHKQTVLAVSSGSLDLPAFELRPENLLHKIGSMFGYQDIDFQMYPEFSRLFLLRGEDEGAIRQTFHHEVLQFFERRAGVSIEGLGSGFAYYRRGTRIDPQQLSGFVEDGIALARVLAK
jgi:hypothetical protein